MRLLAAPEFGFPTAVQELLLADIHDNTMVDWLWGQRRRLITDAIVAAADQADLREASAEEEANVNKLVSFFEGRYRRIHSVAGSPWWKQVESPHVARTKAEVTGG
jgi:hypothetical protein